jgi:hypothetical protein
MKGVASWEKWSPNTCPAKTGKTQKREKLVESRWTEMKARQSKMLTHFAMREILPPRAKTQAVSRGILSP